SLVEFILLGPLDDRRQLQDSPILGDVWVDFGLHPDERRDLLIEPFRGQHAGQVAAEINDQLALEDNLSGGEDPANIAFLQGLIVAHLTFEELLRVVVPRTYWWISRRIKGDNKRVKQGGEPKTNAVVLGEVITYTDVPDILRDVLNLAVDWH